MKIWLPYITAGSGTDVFTELVGEGLGRLGCEVVLTKFAHHFQYAPMLLRTAEAPSDVSVILANSWNGFAFRRPRSKLVTHCNLFVHDPAFAPFRSTPQALFHKLLVRRFEGWTFKSSDGVVAVSDSTAAAMRAVFPAIRPHVIRNGVNVDFFTPELTMKDQGEPFKLLFVGNPTRRKGVDLLEPLMKRLGSDFILEYTSGLRDTGKIDVPNARSLGSLDRFAVREAYRRADLMIFPTRLEGFPLTVLEAMSCGLPVVGSNASSMPEAIESGNEGILCPLEVESFAQAVEALRDAPDRLLQMRQAARNRAVKEFSHTRMAREYLQLFETVLGSGTAMSHSR